MEGVYQPIDIEEPGEDRLRGYSEALGLYVCWEEGMLRFFDPGTDTYLRTHEESETRAETAEARAQEEAVARRSAEARAAELEAELRRLRGE